MQSLRSKDPWGMFSCSDVHQTPTSSCVSLSRNSAVEEYKKNIAGVRMACEILWTRAVTSSGSPLVCFNSVLQTARSKHRMQLSRLLRLIFVFAQLVTAFNLFLVQVFLLLWSLCGNLVSLGRFGNCRACACVHIPMNVFAVLHLISALRTLLLCCLRPSV